MLHIIGWAAGLFGLFAALFFGAVIIAGAKLDRDEARERMIEDEEPIALFRRNGAL